jgi:rhodanese-related sulfurtransferase
MKKISILFAALFLAVAVRAAEFSDISVSDVKALSESKAAVILDVNGSESYNEGHVPGALNFAAIQDNLSAKLPQDKGALIVAYCGSSRCGAYARAAKAAQKLGYTNIKHMSAGISGWKSAGMKTEPGN